MTKKNITIIAFIAPPLIWLASLIFIYKLLPDWQTRGLFGDMFGATNALFSSFALIAVVFSIILQRKEFDLTIKSMTRQLSEMVKSRHLSSQPLPVLKVKKCYVETPRFFYNPPEDEHKAISRYFFEYNIENKSNYVVADISISARMYINIKKKKIEFDSAGNHISTLSANEVFPEEETLNFMFTSDNKSLLFESLTSGDLPTISVDIIYQNIIGGHFRVNQSFHVDVKSDKDGKIIRKWHALIMSFPINYKSELSALNNYKTKNQDDKWSDLFNEVKEKFVAETHDEKLKLTLSEIPGSFNVKILTKEEFSEKIDSVYYGHKLPTLMVNRPF